MESRLSGPGAGRSHTGARGKDFAFPGWSRNLFSYSIYVFWDYLKTTRYSFMIPTRRKASRVTAIPVRSGAGSWSGKCTCEVQPAPHPSLSVLSVIPPVSMSRLELPPTRPATAPRVDARGGQAASVGEAEQAGRLRRSSPLRYKPTHALWLRPGPLPKPRSQLRAAVAVA